MLLTSFPLSSVCGLTHNSQPVTPGHSSVTPNLPVFFIAEHPRQGNRILFLGMKLHELH